MSEHDLSCIVIKQNTGQQQKLLQLLRAGHSGVEIGLANSPVALRSLLVSHSPMLLFYAVADNRTVAANDERKLLRLLQRLAPDCILVRMTPRAWLGLAEVKPTKDGPVQSAVRNAVQNGEICTIATVNNTLFKQQLDYLIAYARLKTKFRQCKHLLSIAELRSQWLVEYSRAAIAYVANDQHLQVNVAYLSLFGLDTVSDAQALRVVSLVQASDRAVFNAVKQAAEQQAKPSNKLLLTLNTTDGKCFRAEIRCVPAVYRGQRCVQLHVHPLLNAEQLSAEQLSAEQPSAGADIDHDIDRTETIRSNPWEQQSESARALAQQVLVREQKTAATPALPAMLAGDAIRQLQPAFKELLNLRGKDHPAMLWAQPWLQYGDSRLDYAQLLANAHDQASRFQLDYRNLQAARSFLSGQHNSPVPQRVVVSLGRWALTNVQQVAQLVKLLKQQSVVNKQLVLGVDSAAVLRHRKTAKFLLPLYKASGVQLLFEQVQAGSEDLFALLELSGSSLVQLHAGYASTMNTDSGVPEGLQALLQQMRDREVATVVAGVQNLSALNVLSETTATYLQGPILDKFSR